MHVQRSKTVAAVIVGNLANLLDDGQSQTMFARKRIAFVEAIEHLLRIQRLRFATVADN